MDRSHVKEWVQGNSCAVFPRLIPKCSLLIKSQYHVLNGSKSRVVLVHTHGHSTHLHLTGDPGDPGACSLKEWPLPLKPLSTLEVTLNSLRFRPTSEKSERPGTCRCERYFKGERSWGILLPQRDTLCWARDKGDRKRRGDGELDWVGGGGGGVKRCYECKLIEMWCSEKWIEVRNSNKFEEKSR